MDTSLLPYALAGLAAAYLLGRVLVQPALLLARLFVRVCLGGAAIWFMNQLGAPAALNPVTALIVGILGLPGLALVWALGWLYVR